MTASLWHTGFLLLVLTAGLAGCEGARAPGPAAPSTVQPPIPQPAPQPTPVVLRVFSEAATGFSTSDVRDAEEQVVQFNTAGELIWTADDTHLPGYPVQGISINAERVCACWFEVRFGTKDGERRAYLTADYGHDNPGTVVDLEVAGGALVVSRTNVFPPGTFTMSGVVTEATPTGPAPLEDVDVWRAYETGWQVGKTDKKGFYEIRGLYSGSRDVQAIKEGYETDTRVVSISGDTRVDIQLVRR